MSFSLNGTQSPSAACKETGPPTPGRREILNKKRFTMTLRNRWHSILALTIVGCLLALPVSAFAKKGKDHFDRGMNFEQAQQWEKAAQEFTLALAADPSNTDYQLHYRRAVFNASQSFMQQGRALAEQRDYVGAYN